MNWKETVEASQKDYGIFCKDLSSNKIIELHAHQIVEAASTIKLPILFLLLTKFQTKQLTPYQKVAVRRSNVGKNGSGILQYFYLNNSFTLYNLALLMIIVSDNVATNVIIELLSKDAINEYIQSLGMPKTELLMAKLDFPDNFSSFRDGNLANTTAYEMASIMELLITDKLLNKQYTKMAKKMLRQNQFSNILRFIEDKKIKEFGSKTGGMADDISKRICINDCAYVIDAQKQAKIIAVFSQGALDKTLPHTKDSASRIEVSKLSQQLYEGLKTTAN